MNWMLCSVLGYVLAQLVFGFVVSRKIRSEADYLVAGRSLGLGLSVFTVFATWFGAETCIGATAQAYGAGLWGVTADPFGYAVCLLVFGALLAVPMWKRKLTTLADLFRERYGALPERVVVVLLVPTSVMWAGAQIRAFGQVLGATSELALTSSITIAAAVVIVYTAMGGMLADALADFAQGLVLLFGLVMMLVLMIASGDVETALTQHQGTVLGHAATASGLELLEAWSVPVLGSLVAQELVGRVVAARSPEIARKGTLIAAAMYLATGLIPVLVGLVAARLLPGVEPEQVLVHQAARYFPGFARVIFLGALVSAILSTVDSALLAAGSLSAHNLVLPLMGDVSETRKVRINRWAVTFFGVIAYGLALSTQGVYALVEEASAFGTAGVVVCVMFGLFTEFGGTRAALASLATGILVYLTGQHALHWPQPFLASLLAATLAYLAGAFSELSAARSSP
ncbi:MAG: sodium:solute symporter family protein [Polyangiales bacterium]